MGYLEDANKQINIQKARLQRKDLEKKVEEAKQQGRDEKEAELKKD